MRRPRPETAARVGVIVVVGLLAVAGGFAATAAVRSRTDNTPAAPPTPSAYQALQATPGASATPSSGPEPVPSAVRAALAAAVGNPALGSRLRAEVVDVSTGAVLYDHGGVVPTAPASTAKLLTAAAVLDVHRATDRIVTRVVTGSGGAIVLVGGGDPTLTGAPAGKPGAYPQAARISDLAAQLRRAHVTPSKIVVDDSLFTGPTVSPAWAPEDVPSDYASAITALLADGGRAHPGDPIRSASPDVAAGHELAAALGTPRLPVGEGRAPADATSLASVQSAPIGVLVEQMLQASDNVIAECLARQVALAEHQPASFTGAAAAIRDVLRRLGVDPGAGLEDGSGLAAADRVSPTALAGVLRLVVVQARLHDVLAGLPVSAWSGTLAVRYRTGAAKAAAGAVRAKTGTLTGVSTLAGVVHDRSGRLLAFALMADRAPSTPAADAALDGVVARLAGCGCG